MTATATGGKMTITEGTRWWLTEVFSDLDDKTQMLVAADAVQEDGLESCARLLRFLAAPDAKMREVRLLFTGSRVYGNPKPDSDFDLVMLGTPYDLWELRRMCDSDSHDKKDLDYYGAAGIDTAMRFGPVNLLLVSQDNQFDAWAAGTVNLLTQTTIQNRPRTRPEAVDEFQHQFRAHYVNRTGQLEKKNLPRCPRCKDPIYSDGWCRCEMEEPSLGE